MLKDKFLLDLNRTQITDAGCAALAATLNSGALPALVQLFLDQIRASAAAKAAVYAAVETPNGERSACWRAAETQK